MLSQLKPITTAIRSYAQELSWSEFARGDLRTLAVFTFFFLLFALEARGGCRRHAGSVVRQSYFTNFGALILNDALMSLLAVSSLWIIAERYSSWGLLSGLANPVIKGVGALLLLDLVLYGWHRLTHTVDVLWRLHKVHHSDRCMNVSTAFRLHGGELLLTTLLKAACIVLMGIDSTLLLVNEAVITLFVMFHHANITCYGERWLGRLIVVPYLHRAHHSTKRFEHDRNYGAVFSIWDRLFGTFIESEPAALGLQGVAGQSLLELMRFGLIRDLPPQPAQPRNMRAMIAEAAYFRAERRGFAPGDELVDWLEAEREILAAGGAQHSTHQSRERSVSSTGLFSSLQDTVRATVYSWCGGVRADVAALRRLPRMLCGGVAKRLRTAGPETLRSKRRLAGLRMIRLCTQD